jgi:CSLREA domain-containing protein
MRVLRTVLALGALWVCANAKAQGAHEPFDYPLNDNLAGANGGNGFSGPWMVTANGPSTAVTGAQSGVIVAGLEYTDALGQSLPVSGGAWQTNSGLQFGQGQRATTASFGAAGSSVWMSFLVRQAATTSGTNYALGTPGSGFGFGAQAMHAGVAALPGASVSSFFGSDGRARDIGNVAGKTTLVVMRIDFAASGNDTLRAWFDPLLGQPLGSPMLIESLRNYAENFNGATLLWGDNRSFVFDELRIGADIGWTVEDVADAYEPFDYPLGTHLHNASGGSGFDGPWTVTQNGPSSIVTGAQSGTIVAGLSYPGLSVTGNALRTSPAVIAGQAQRLTRRSLGAAGSSTWLSFLVRQEGSSGAAQDYATATPGVGFGNGAAAMTGGRGPTPNAFICAFYSGVECTSPFNPGGTPGDVTYIVLRVDYNANTGANDSMSAWFNPVIGQPLGAPQLTGSFRNYADLFSGLSLVWGDQRSFDFDELRVGSTPPAGLPSVVVDTTSDDGSAPFQACTAAPGDCSLRGALIKTQRDLAGEDTIGFNIPSGDPGCDTGGVCTITLITDSFDLASLVPGIQTGPSQGFTIDGYTQPGASANTLPPGQGSNAQPRIKLVGPVGTARQITTHTPFTIRGLIFQNIALIHQRGDGGFGANGHPDNLRYELYGNFFGVDADGVTGLDSPSLGGTAYVRSSNLIRGVRVGSGDPADINLFGAGAQKPNFCLIILGENRVQGNFIGTDRSGIGGSGCLNGLQVSHQASPNKGPLDIGGAAPGQGNVIANHILNAIDVIPAERDVLVRIRGNKIGIGVDGLTSAPNFNANSSVCTPFAAIRGGLAQPGSAQVGGLAPGEGNLFGPNGRNRGRCPAPFVAPAPYMQTVASGEGMGVWQVQGNRYLGVEGMAVDLVQTNDTNNSLPQRLPNDPDDADPLGANRRQNFPTISAFGLAGDQVNLTYRVDSTPANSRYPLSIEFLKDDGQGNLTPIGHDTYTAAEAQTDKAIGFALPAGISLGASDIVIATATTTGDSTPGENISGETSETSFYPLESFSLVSITPTTTPSGVPVMVRVRAVAAPGVPFKPNGRVLVQASDGSSPFEECTALLAPVAAARTSEGECQVGISAPPGSVGVRVSYNAAQNSFALADGRHPDSVLQLVTVTPGVTALELVSGNNQTAPVGDAFAQSLVVRAVGAAGATFAGVPVQFSGPAAGAGASFDPVTAVSGTDGLASTAATAIRAGGSYSVTARVGALTQTFALTNEPGLDTALEIVSNLPNPSALGQPVTVTTALNPEAGGPAPSGSIAVTANTGEACNIVLPATSCALTFATLGERVIQAFYPGDANYRSSKAAFADHSVANLPSLRINDVSLNEGNIGTTAFVFTVTLQNPSGAAVSVDFATANDSAVAPGDYTASNGTLNFSGSTTTQSIAVQVSGDTTVEPDERFFVNLSNASGATIADAQGSGAILDDDQPPPPAASIDDVIVQEPVLRGITQTRARFTVGLDRPAPGLVSLRVRTQGGTAMQNQDFDGNDFILRFNAGQREKLVDVFIREDDLPELTESFFVELSDPQGLTIADALGEASILDDGPDAALTVNSAADPGDGNCTPGDCTLREAILRANTLQSVRIGFDIPGVGPHTILLGAPLPNLGDRIHTVDGYTQPGSRPNAVAISDNRDLDADQRIVIDAGGIGGSALNLQHGGTIRGLRLQRLGLNVLHRLNARPTRIVGNHLVEAGVSIRPDGASSDALIDILVGGEGADRNRLGSLGFSSNNSGLRPGTRVRIEGNVIDARIAIIDDNPNGIRSILHLLGNRAPGVDLDPGSSVFDGINPGLQLDSSGNHYSGDPAIEVLPSNFREFGQLRFVGDRFSPGARAAVIHAHSQPGNEHRVLVAPATMDARAEVIDLGADGPSGNDIGDHDDGPNDLLNHPELLSATFNDRGERLRIRFRLEPEGVGDGYVAHFYAQVDGQLEWLGARAYLGGIDEFDLTLPRRLPLGTEIHALTEFEVNGTSSERSANPVPVTGNQLLAQAAATRENAGVLRFALSSQLPLAAPRTLRYRSIDGSALAGSDYTAVDASIVAPAGDFEVFVDVPLLNDTLVERDESLQLEVWSDEDFSLGSALATATITDDDVSRREVRQFDTLDLDALDGRRGFRIEHRRADEALLIRMPNDFLGGSGPDLALAINEVTGEGTRGGLRATGSLQLLPDLAAPYPATLSLIRGTAQFPLFNDFQMEGAALLPAPLGDLRSSSSRPTLGLRGNSGVYLIHGRASVPASGSIQSLASGADGQTLALPAAAQRIVAVGDINGDGRLDAAVAAPPRAHLLLGRNDGAPMTLGPVIRAANGPAGLEILQIAGAGDLNGDGFEDLVVRGRNAAGYALWLIPGSASFGGAVVPDFGQVQVRDPFGSSCREFPPGSGTIVCDPNGSSAELAGPMEFAHGPLGRFRRRKRAAAGSAGVRQRPDGAVRIAHAGWRRKSGQSLADSTDLPRRPHRTGPRRARGLRRQRRTGAGDRHTGRRHAAHRHGPCGDPARTPATGHPVAGRLRATASSGCTASRSNARAGASPISATSMATASAILASARHLSAALTWCSAASACSAAAANRVRRSHRQWRCTPPPRARERFRSAAARRSTTKSNCCRSAISMATGVATC